MRKHLYSASVCAKSVFPIVPKLDYIMQYFTLFPVMDNKLGHKLTNIEIARIKKVLITFFVYIKCQTTELQCANINIQQAFAQKLSSQLFPSSTVLCSISCSFQWCTANWGTSSPTSKRQGLIRCNCFNLFIELHCANIYIPQAFSQNLSSQLLPSSTTIFARNYGTAAVISYNLKGIAPPVPPVQCWANKNLMSAWIRGANIETGGGTEGGK
jgi:hypothetical protein